MRIYKIKLVEVILSISIIKYCLCLPTGPRDGSSIPLPGQIFTIESDSRPVSKKMEVSIPGRQPSKPRNQDTWYVYKHRNEPRVADHYIEDTLIIMNKSPKNTNQRGNQDNVNVDSLRRHNLDFPKNMPTITPLLKEVGDIRTCSSDPDKITFKNDEENKIPYSEDIETSTYNVSTGDHTAGTTDNETTTFDDGFELRIGVPDQVVASLLG